MLSEAPEQAAMRLMQMFGCGRLRLVRLRLAIADVYVIFYISKLSKLILWPARGKRTLTCDIGCRPCPLRHRAEARGGAGRKRCGKRTLTCDIGCRPCLRKGAL